MPRRINWSAHNNSCHVRLENDLRRKKPSRLESADYAYYTERERINYERIETRKGDFAFPRVPHMLISLSA